MLFPTNSASLDRRCAVPWAALGEVASNDNQICITMLTDANHESRYREARRIDFSDVLEATWNNKMKYASKHNYKLLNASSLVDINRPPSWSKILAVQDALRRGCHWVFWMDPDSLVMNSEKRIEDIVPGSGDADLIITRDPNGYNAGMWMVRNSNWTMQFLNDWWSMTSFILPPGQVRSGDNFALEELLGQKNDRDEHVYVAPQCAFNSYTWNSVRKNWRKYIWDRQSMVAGMYREGDFVVHFAGMEDKMAFIQSYEKRAV